MRLSKGPASLSDDLSLAEFGAALEKNIKRLNEIKTSELKFGPKLISKDEYISGLELLADHIELGISKDGFVRLVKTNFDFYEVYGRSKWGEVFITSYFAPEIQGAKQKTEIYTQPIYSIPIDLVDIRIDEFVETHERLSVLKDPQTDKAAISILRGRLIKDKNGKSKIIPYYSRREIDETNVLSDKSEILAWVDPIDAFFLHVQGSGTIRFEDGEELVLGYASQNGHKYESIGKQLLDVIPKEKMSMQSLERHLRSLPYNNMKEILHVNPSYIFFRELEGRPLTSFGTETVDGRTIATDTKYFPKGALVYLEFPVPVYENSESIEPVEWEMTSRFVLNQDSGGAIKGPDRVDLFWGSGKEAARYAGVMKSLGKLYYLVPKDVLIEKLKD
ncbi:MAG: hypothetical protein GTO02_04510 [Candidatus Dadabacteria bacterium]|nr:hypothetical protein [Candidatus Dadabacteria bacterium]NIQ13681.1 hypothetical protein [Candidatus Dadabacteria bacterium]